MSNTTTTTTESTAPKMNAYDKLYTGEGGIDFIGRSKIWYIITVALILISLGSMLFRGFDLSIDFEGGTKMSMQAGDLVAEEVEDTFVEATGVEPELTQIVGAGDSRTLEINSEHLTQEQIDAARLAIYEEHEPLNAEGEPTPDAIGDSTVSESWGSTITERMILALVVFLIAAAIYVAVRLEKEMAVAAMAALFVDGIVIMGIYSVFGLEVSPAMIIGLLTVLTFSIYDTVIVFDKVKENTSGVLGSRRSTYAEEANLAVNQTVMRSISTSVISALPIIALLVVAVWLLGVGTLKDLALIQLIGVLVGIFSSLFLATPLLVTIVNREDKYKKHNKAVAEYREQKSSTAHGDVVAEASDEDDEQLAGPKRRVSTPVSGEQVPAEKDEVVRDTPRTSTWRPDRR
ncbi:protein translocase subunit SecF [Corynebacterium pilosum]|uniref:Protein-export membrane protein SecF n=1 Tax=Corynebacterium pilosum TaxID=35756 RepID=A0A376CSG5_9CORY|nr:protein translocase subunit SecF [Corynebacterium pilosum]STC70568.1 preprotein translocase subunit SecF [Corynebacterium pilosum]